MQSRKLKKSRAGESYHQTIKLSTMSFDFLTKLRLENIFELYNLLHWVSSLKTKPFRIIAYMLMKKNADSLLLPLMYLLVSTIFTFFPCNYLYSQVNANFNVNHTSGCSPLSVSFTDLSTGNPTSWVWDFGNGQSSIARNPTATYINPGKYTVTLSVTSSTSTSSLTKKDFIIVHKNPVADFSVNKNLACANDNISFNSTTIKGDADIDKWYWDFGDGNFSAANNPTHAYTDAGKYSITLIVTDKNLCTHSVMKKDLVDIKAVKANFSVDQTFFCLTPAVAVFSNLSSSNAISYQWDFGNGEVSTAQNPQNTYISNGTYTVKLHAQDQYGCSNVMEKKNYITVSNFEPDFHFIKIDSCPPAQIEFINKSKPDNGLTYQWNFADGNSSNLKDPFNTYQNSGDYQVRLTVSTQGCKQTVTKTIRVHSKPTFSFTADTVNHCKTPFTVRFNVNGNDLNQYSWDFGDKNGSTTQNAVHQYNDYGYYTVGLTARSPEGCTHTYLRREYIKASPSGFHLIIATLEGCKPLKVRFIISDTSLVPLNIFQTASGHGVYSSKISDSFIYNDTGKFNMEIIAFNSRGCIAEFTQEISVGAPPVANFKDFFYKGCNDSFIHFTNFSNNSNPKANAFKWYFGDGDSSEAEHPKHKYQDTGFMNVKMIAYYNGCPDTITRDSMLYIYSPIVKIKDIKACYPVILNEVSKSLGGTQWAWYLDNKFYSSQKNPEFRLEPGTYKLKLILTDHNTACIDSDSIKIRIIKPPETKIMAEILEPCPPAKVELSDTSTRQLTYCWSIGSDTSYVKRPVFTLKGGGLFSVKLKIKDEDGCETDYYENDFIKISAFNMEFTQSHHAGCLPLKVDVSDKSVSLFPIKLRKWDFDLGNVLYSYGTDTSFTYLTMPVGRKQNVGFNIRLTLTDEKGCLGYESNKVYPTKPKPHINIKTNDNCKETEVELSTYLNDTSVYLPAKLDWFINNIPAGNSPFLRLKFDTDTFLDIRLTITDAFECKQSVYKQISISHAPPLADFSYMISPSVNDCPPMVVHFYNKSAKGKNDIVKYYWDFGNNTYSTVNSPVNSYSYPGTYSVSLIAEDSEGCRDTIVKPDIVKVNGATGSYDFLPKRGCGSVECIFTSTTVNAIEFLWDFGNGHSSLDRQPVHTYNYGGIFKPLLILKDSLGCLTSIISRDSVIVFNNPHAQFALKDKITCLGKEVHFINNTWHEQDILKWEWDLGNGFKTNAFEPLYRYSDTGRYSVSLKVTDVEGCEDSVYLPFVVIVYFDTVNHGIPYLYRTTQLAEFPFTEVLFSAVSEYDFMNYTLFRTDSFDQLKSYRVLSRNVEDTMVVDSFFALFIPQCYHVKSFDFCENPSDASRTHCLVNLMVNASEAGNMLQWTPYIGWDKIEKYSIFRWRPVKATNFEKIEEVNAQTLSYLDTNVNCSEIYYYKIVAHEKDSYLQLSSSNIDSCVATKTMYIDPVKLIRVSVENEHILVEWEAATRDYNFGYNLIREAGASDKRLIYVAPAHETSFTDKNVNTAEKSYIYKVQVFHPECLFFSKTSNVAKSILLKLNKSENDENIFLEWNGYYHWDEGVSHYKMQRLNPRSHHFEEIAILQSDSSYWFIDNEPLVISHSFKVTAVSAADTAIISNSNILSDRNHPRISIPNAFTPNSDGLNDYFEAVCYGCTIHKMQIFNRWGELIFESTEENARWDGHFKGELCPLGVYYFNIFANSEDGISLHYGTLSLLR